MKSLKDLVKGSKRPLVMGIGGGGDVVGAVPTYRYLRGLGLDALIGGLTWERYVNDPEPGPRKLDETINLERISETVGLANADTETEKGVRFTESVVAEALGVKTVLVDLNQGVQGAIEGLNEATKILGVDSFFGIDVGGDVLASGDEEGLHSMLADSMMLAAMVNLKMPAVLGVLGCCTDGELTLEQFIQQITKIASYDGLLGVRGLNREDVVELERIVPKTKTESSALAVKAAKGVQGEIEIRGGSRKAMVTPMSALTFYLDPKVVFERVSKVAKDLVPTRTLEDAQSVLERAGVPSEFTFERNGVWKKFDGRNEPLEVKRA